MDVSPSIQTSPSSIMIVGPNVLNTDVLDPTTDVYRRVIVAAGAIAEVGFVDYAVRTSELASEFALTEAAARWAKVHHEDLEMAGGQNESKI
ncbi:hypothetical protein SPBR_09149 [Sporothrix brasiliensis 5110]|uniref:Uncharacterized protein n=1 Tax=Sporothrix brasiliensis 5110 TaxID=1398154 RepID=A0A0C2J0S6_9PEZI|nr:uncharacterized protein SPBR_09149 [Sporothrix brasiliensis 5110]KIH92595.1 hypothetical protein SPBR_09149 [Sporothrix brasiliensis 5110]